MDANAPRTFRPTEHLASEAVAAYVDGELSAGAVERAESHLKLCAECLADVAAQQHARRALRQVSSSSVEAPTELVGNLSQIPRIQAAPTNERDTRKWGRPWRK